MVVIAFKNKRFQTKAAQLRVAGQAGRDAEEEEEEEEDDVRWSFPPRKPRSDIRNKLLYSAAFGESS